MRQRFGALRRRVTPDHLVALFEEQLGEVRTVLAGDAGDDCAFRHVGPTACRCAPRRLPASALRVSTTSGASRAMAR